MIGEFAVKPRFQGGGSSHINSFKISSLMDALKEYENVTYIKGFSADEDCYEERTILDHSSGEISTEDAAVLMEALSKGLAKDGYHFLCRNELPSPADPE